MTFFTFVFGLIVAGMILTLIFGLRARGQAQTIEQERLLSIATPMTLEEVELSQPFSERVVRPAWSNMLNFLGRLTPQRNIQDLQHRLEVAGRPFGWTVVNFVGLRVLCALLFGALIFVVTIFTDVDLFKRLLLTLGFVALGYYLPLSWLNMRMRARKRELIRALPDGLDMLNICVGAGLGFDAALSKVGDQWKTALSEEFNRVVAEIRLGKTRRQALLDLAHRTEVVELENFVATIVQADQLGVSIARVLRAQAEQMRILRRQRAEELARQAVIKLLFPLVFMIFPALLVVLLGPAVPKVMNALGAL